MKKLVMSCLFVACFAISASARTDENYTCVQHFYNYGLTTAAQANCGFGEWNEAVTEYAGEWWSY